MGCASSGDEIKEIENNQKNSNNEENNEKK